MASSVERQNTLATRTPRENRVITDGPRPKHAQLSDVLADLAAHRLGPDAAIPSERELMTTYEVSRSTVRKAIESLIADGLLHRIHGKGTFVSRPRLESRLHLASFSQDMRRRGLTPSTTLLGIEADRPPIDVAKALDLGADGVAWRIDRVRRADGQPIALENGWYPRDLLPGLDRQDLGGSLYDIFRTTYGHAIDSAEQTLWGEAADAATARRLDAPLNTPLLVFRRVSAAAGQPLEYVVSRYRGDRYQLHMSLARDGAGPGLAEEQPGTGGRRHDAQEEVDPPPGREAEVEDVVVASHEDVVAEQRDEPLDRVEQADHDQQDAGERHGAGVLATGEPARPVQVGRQ